MESQVFDSIDIGLPPEYDDFHAVTLNRFGNQIFLQLLDFFFQIIAYLFFQFGILFDGLLDGLRQIRHIVEHRTQFTQGILQHEGVVFSRFGRYRFDTAHTCRDGAFANHTQGADHAGCRDMRTTAQLDRVAIFDHTDFIAILFTEQSHSAQCFRFGNRHIAMLFQRIVGTDLFAHQLFHLTDFLVRHFLEVGEVKTQRVGRDIGTFLFDMCSQHLTQRLVQQVSSRVVAFALDTFLLVDFGGKSHRHIFRQFSDQMYRQVVFAFRVDHVDRLVVSNQPTGVADLSTHLCVERSLVQNDLI